MRLPNRSLTLLLLGLAASASLAACGGGGGGPAQVDVETLAIAATGISVPTGETGSMQLAITSAGAEPGAFDLLVELSFDGGATWHAARGFEPGALTGVPRPSVHALAWNSVADLGPRALQGAQMRVTPARGEARGTALVAILPPIDNVHTAARRVNHHMHHYGPISTATLRRMETYDVVAIHVANGDVSLATARDLMDGVDASDPRDDVLVLGYITIGEDDRTIGMTPAEMLSDPRFVGDGTGPRVDPRGPDADGQSVVGLDPLGNPAPGGTGYASWYLNDNAIDNDPGGVGDGIPDGNDIFGGLFVNAGDPKWFDVVDTMLFDGVDGRPGMRELLTTGFGRGYALDACSSTQLRLARPTTTRTGRRPTKLSTSGQPLAFTRSSSASARPIPRRCCSRTVQCSCSTRRSRSTTPPHARSSTSC